MPARPIFARASAFAEATVDSTLDRVNLREYESSNYKSETFLLSSKRAGHGGKGKMERRQRAGYEESRKVLTFYSFQGSFRKFPVDDTQNCHDVSQDLIQNPEIA